jgi:hypothetical protein
MYHLGFAAARRLNAPTQCEDMPIRYEGKARFVILWNPSPVITIYPDCCDPAMILIEAIFQNEVSWPRARFSGGKDWLLTKNRCTEVARLRVCG